VGVADVLLVFEDEELVLLLLVLVVEVLRVDEELVVLRVEE
jgi:hypothetical protein